MATNGGSMRGRDIPLRGWFVSAVPAELPYSFEQWSEKAIHRCALCVESDKMPSWPRSRVLAPSPSRSNTSASQDTNPQATRRSACSVSFRGS